MTTDFLMKFLHIHTQADMRQTLKRLESRNPKAFESFWLQVKMQDKIVLKRLKTKRCEVCNNIEKNCPGHPGYSSMNDSR